MRPAVRTRQDVPKSTSFVSTVPAVRPGAVWYFQYRFVCAITCSGGGAPHCRLVLGRVGVADEGRVVPSGERAVERRADARIGLCADDDESSDTEARQHGLEGRVLEGVAVALLDERLCVARNQLGDDLPVVAPPAPGPRRSAGPRRRGPAPAVPSRRGCRRSRRRRRARARPRRRRSARRRRGVRCSAGSRVWSWFPPSHVGRRTACSDGARGWGCRQGRGTRRPGRRPSPTRR